MEAKHWSYYFKRMKEEATLVIYYPTCGGGEECITACPQKDKVWTVVPMKVSLFGAREKVRRRPFMVHPENCLMCYLCAQACPTGSIFKKGEEVKHPYLRLAKEALRLPFKKRYNLAFILRKEHIEKFKRNN
ncbi:MAG: ferredoxin family protein [Crenarchaeota archaeon]|nr:ferredoxin family protein [Thermoproteota archaeon]